MLDQLAFADFIARGELERHLRRVRLRYRERRSALVAALSRALPDARVGGVAAGLFVPVLLAGDVDEEALVSAAAAHRVGIESMAWHRLRGAGPPGLVLGFANLAEPAIERGVAALALAFESAM